MNNQEAIKRMESIREYLCAGNPIWDVNEMRDVFELVISALQALDEIYAFIMKSEASETTDGVLEIIDAFEAQELSKNSTELDKGNGDLQPTCNKLANDICVHCKDTISRQAAIDAIVDCTVYGNADDLKEAVMQENAWNKWSGGVLEALEAVEELPSAQPEPQWIPCSERLPEEETEVLVTRTFLGCKDGSHGWNNHIPPSIYVEVAQYFDGEWTALSDEYKVARSKHTDPIAWMPLPSPYRAERRTDDLQ